MAVAVLGLPPVFAWHAERRADTVVDWPGVGNDDSIALLERSPNADRVIRLAVLGDLQIGAPMLPRIMAEVSKRGPFDFIVHTGDFSSRPREGHFNIALSELGEHAAVAPLLVVPGNHDVRESARDRTISPWFRRAFGPSEYVLQYGGALFVFLDNSMGPLSDAQYAWFENTLQRYHASDKPVVVFMHAQPISWAGDGKASPEVFYSELFDVLKRYRVDAVFTGNWHGYYREERAGTKYVINGHGGDLDNENPFAKAWFTVMEISNGTVAIQPVSVDRTMPSLLASHYSKAVVAGWGHTLAERPWAWALAWIGTALAMVWLGWETQGILKGRATHSTSA